MNINRHNYEEFFLLYVDNELSAAERNAVELFVQENADVKEELSLLLQTVYTPNEVIFDNKNALLKDDFTVMQQNLLLYIDDELSTAEKINIEKTVTADAVFNKELSILQQTKLQPDTSIVFAHKNLLYRKESGNVIGLPWRRIAAAAILLGFGTWAIVATFNKKQEGIVTITNNITPLTPQTNGATINPAITSPQNSITENASSKNDAITATTSPKNNSTENILQQKESNIAAAKENKITPGKILPKPDYEKINNTGSNEIAIASVKPVITATDKINSGNKAPVEVNSNNTIDEPASGYALNTNFSETNAGESFAEEDKKKTRLGGFFRKVKRVVERNTNVKTGNGIMVAGFDIAIK